MLICCPFILLWLKWLLLRDIILDFKYLVKIFFCIVKYPENGKKYLDKTLILGYNIHMKKYKKKPWTNAERKVLLTKYKYIDIDQLAEYLPGRSITAIRSQAWYLRKRGLNFK